MLSLTLALLVAPTASAQDSPGIYLAGFRSYDIDDNWTETVRFRRWIDPSEVDPVTQRGEPIIIAERWTRNDRSSEEVTSKTCPQIVEALTALNRVSSSRFRVGGFPNASGQRAPGPTGRLRYDVWGEAVDEEGGSQFTTVSGRWSASAAWASAASQQLMQCWKAGG